MFAYLDTGSGSLLLQMLLGGIAGLGVFFKMNWHRFRARFTSAGRKASGE